jgi:hypothetical protein
MAAPSACDARQPKFLMVNVFTLFQDTVTA